MTALPPEVAADLERRVAELEQKLRSALGERNDAIAREAAMGAENARLYNELAAARDRQTASADILRTIADASGDAERALYRIAETSMRLFGAPSTTIHIAEGDGWSKTIRVGDSAKRVGAGVPEVQLRIGGRNMPGTIVAENRQVNIPDVDNVEPAISDWPGLPYVRASGTRSMSGSPLRREGKAMGALIVYRDRLAPFTDEEMALQQTFADQAAIAIENARLFNETRETLERQTATSEILKVIASSPSDVQPVFDAILDRALHLCEAAFGFLTTWNGERFGFAAQRGVPAELAQHFSAGMDQPRPGDAHWRLLAGEVLIHNLDQKDEDAYRAGNPLRRAVVDLGGARSALVVALRKNESLRGAITIYRKEVRPFSQPQIALLRHFADQAVIAIENVRLFNETQQALERQTATAEILKVIASSPSDVQPVFEAIAESAKHLLGAFSTTVLRFIGDELHLVAYTPTNPAADEALKTSFPRLLAEFPTFALVRNGATVQFPDIEADDVPLPNKELGRLRGFRSVLFTPLMNQGAPVGMISVTRAEPGRFADHHIQLLQTFADHAVIAIENARLFNETKEALERQTATADILKVIASSPSDVQPVFDAIAASSNRLLNGFSTAVFRFLEGTAQLAAFTPTNPAADEVLAASFPRPVGEFEPFLMAQDGKPILIADTEEISNVQIREIARARGFRSMLFVPLMSGGASTGIISVTRLETGSFADHHVRLLQTFADQAVIAIENTRLFNEVQQRTRDLTEALTYQTGSANILKVIASSPTDVEPVLKSIVESACELCEAYDSVVLLKQGDNLCFSAHHGPIPLSIDTWPINRKWIAGRAFVDQKPIHVQDLLAEGDDFPDGREMSVRMGHRTIVGVPLLREGESIGVIIVRRTEVNPFSDKQIALLQTFADQAVIAIGNVRLFEEVQAKTHDLSEALQQQTATSDVLKVISRSAFNLQAVLDTLVESAARLCESDKGVIFKRDGDLYRWSANFGNPPELETFAKANPFKPGRYAVTSRVALEGKTFHVADVLADPEYGASQYQKLGGYRTILCVPLLREGVPIGVFALTRSEVKPFTERQIELVQSFADQAVIAIENVRLFDEVQARTKELAASLDELRAAQDRLIQTEKLASLGQLTAGIAHEIKNPLNFVNNFAALSAELTEELNDALKPAAISDNIRAEVDELTGLLRDNLEKVVQHGKRADSIVKNMLLHSREGSGDHRPADINALIEESLNLAYHGARAEKADFNVTLERDFDPAAGILEVFPQDISRVFLNLVSNGFYAVTKRQKELGEAGFEPTLRATTKNLGNTVEIRIRDNGTGIPPKVREKMFNPFFTTKPAGEGTGLGLSMSHDIIVKQHGGTIDVDTQPGHFTEFRIVLPRTSNFADKSRG